MSRSRLNVGLFVSNIDNDFDSAIVQGALDGAKEVDANLIIFPGRYLKGNYHDKERTRCEYQYNTLFSYVNKKNIDVLLISLGSIGTTLSDREKKVFLDMYHDIPIMLLACEYDNYSSINFDNESGLRDGITELIVEKGCKHICMVSGPLTNDDAIIRLNVYKDTLTKHNIPFTEDNIVYGNFSEYSQEVVEELLNKNPEVDAIVFANDSMAIGGYEVFKKHNINVGEDIMVMGFDDSPIAAGIMPSLSSVRASSMELGRVGVIEGVKLSENSDIRNVKINTEFVSRTSTGNKENDVSKSLIEAKIDQYFHTDAKKAATLIVNSVFSNNEADKSYVEFKNRIIDFTEGTINQIVSVDGSHSSVENVSFLLEQALDSDYGRKVDIKYIFTLFETLKTLSNQYSPEKNMLAGHLVYSYLTTIITFQINKNLVEEKFRDDLLWMGNSIARDMLYHGEESDESFATVCDKLKRLGIKSSYLYALPKPFINDNPDIWHDWQIPQDTLLKSYYDEGSDIVVVPEDKQRMDALQIYDNKYMRHDKRYDLLISNIFINEEQLGMLVSEVNFEQIKYMRSLIVELSSAFKIIYMLKTQAGIQKQLENSLKKIKESNKMLENMSKQDELTGVYNRRGFFDTANARIKHAKNKDKKAILIFADMDNLKLVNDQYGHDDGDFALRGIAEILTDSMRASDIVARIGGDEFAAVAITERTMDPSVICNRIKEICERFNADSGKPYYVGVSVGYAEFDCGSNVEIETYLDMADERLYENKKNKRKNIEK